MVFPQVSFADELEVYCEIKAGDWVDADEVAKQISEKGCEKGDMLILVVKHFVSLSDIVALACDLERPFVKPANEVFICSYLGYLRKPR